MKKNSDSPVTGLLFSPLKYFASKIYTFALLPVDEMLYLQRPNRGVTEFLKFYIKKHIAYVQVVICFLGVFQKKKIKYEGYLFWFRVLMFKIIKIKIEINMKNLFKFGFFALAISLSAVACNSNKPAEENTDTVAVEAVDTTIVVDTTAADTTVVDTVVAQ